MLNVRCNKRHYWVRALRWILLLGWSGLIWYLSSRPLVPVPSLGEDVWDFVIRQGGHLALHAVLALLAWWAVYPTWGSRSGLVFALAFSIPQAILDELYQNHLPGRNANLEDVVYNLVGVVGMLFVIWLWQGSRKSYPN